MGVHVHRAPLPLEAARRIIRGALRTAREQGLQPVTVVVLDAGGHPIALEREDGVGIARFDVARGKAWAALGVGMTSGALGVANHDRPAFLAAVAGATGGRVVPVAGGVPVLDDTSCIIGAVGVSGDASDADERVAIAGIEAGGYVAGVSA